MAIIYLINERGEGNIFAWTNCNLCSNLCIRCTECRWMVPGTFIE